ncbi:MAG: ATP synthase F1 subunit epsilon [Epulopiscium sp.]|nr:ATP synthase F1 subunit epsilon [Candidatus Epulonipiscium sp.]
MAEQTFNLQIMTPMGAFYQKPAQRIIVTTTEGEMGILPGHEPTTAILNIGAIDMLGDQGETKTAVVTGGFIVVSEDEGVRIFADTAEWPEDIDIARAIAAKERAERRLQEKAADVNMARAEAALRRALIRIEVGQKSHK